MSIKQTAIALRDGYVSRQVRRAKLPDFPPAPIRRVRLTFLGRVQKVGFRQEVTELAQRLDLTGFCQNLPNGSVLAEIQGPSNRIEYLIAFMNSLKRIQIRELHRQSLPLLPSEEGFVQQESPQNGGPAMAPKFEIERKFLIQYPDVTLLESWPGMTRFEMVQTYLLSAPGDEVRVRQRTENGNSQWFHTVKQGEGIKRQEAEREITREEYQALLTQADPTKRVLHKTRYCLPYRGKLLEVDLYPFWQDQAVLEVELEQEDDLISIPPELTVLREVTGDAAYKNAVLAKTDKEVPL